MACLNIYVKDHLTLSLEGAISYDSHNGICLENHLTLIPEGAISYDTYNSICVVTAEKCHFSRLELIELLGKLESEISNILLTSLLINFTMFSSASKFFSNTLVSSSDSLDKLLLDVSFLLDNSGALLAWRSLSILTFDTAEVSLIIDSKEEKKIKLCNI